MRKHRAPTYTSEATSDTFSASSTEAENVTSATARRRRYCRMRPPSWAFGGVRATANLSRSFSRVNAPSDGEGVVDQRFGGGGEAREDFGVAGLEGAEGAFFEDGGREAVFVHADERAAQGRRVGDDEPLAREPRALGKFDDAHVGVARRAPVRLAEDVDALGDVGDAHVAVNDALHPRELLEAGVQSSRP